MLRKRLLIYNPDIQPDSFVFFFSLGESGQAISIREYHRSAVRTYHAQDLRDRAGRQLTADRIVSTSRIVLDAPRHNVNDLTFWRRVITEANSTHLGRRITLAQPDPPPDRRPQQSFSVADRQPFPLLNAADLHRSRKATKRGDLDRILFSPNSEDYVTWNWVQLMQLQSPSTWWPPMISLAAQADAGAHLPVAETPSIELWKTVPSPVAYERESRARMRLSANPTLRQRAEDSAPVEGASEIDLCFSGVTYLVFVEAKLGADISLRTTYDPCRDQIARNIDCLLETACGRTPHFWMFVRDRDEARAYMQLLRTYRRYPENLGARLPHRNSTEIRQVTSTLSALLWSDLVELVRPEVRTGATTDVIRELIRRTG